MRNELTSSFNVDGSSMITFSVGALEGDAIVSPPWSLDSEYRLNRPAVIEPKVR